MKFQAALILTLLSFSLAQAEDVEPRTKLPSSSIRIRGAVSLKKVPWGFVALGGPILRQLETGKTQWETLFTLPKHSLYRVAADDKGRLLAAWEEDDVIHLFVPKLKQHLTFPKPGKPSSLFRTFNLEDIFFTKEGDAIVYMDGMTGSCTSTTVAYRYKLDGKSPPVLLFQQKGFWLYSSDKEAIYGYSSNDRMGCDYNGCFPLTGIVAYEIHGDSAVKKVLLYNEGKEYQIARIVWGSQDGNIKIVVFDKKNARHLLSWGYGQGRPEFKPLPKGINWNTEREWLTADGDYVQVWMENGYSGLRVERLTPKGEMTVTRIPKGDRHLYWDTNIYALKDRANGDLFVHWGNRIFLIPKSKPVRVLNLEPYLKRKNEWAGADIYDPDTEALWVGVEVGGGRDFIFMSFADIEKNSKLMK